MKTIVSCNLFPDDRPIELKTSFFAFFFAMLPLAPLSLDLGGVRPALGALGRGNLPRVEVRKDRAGDPSSQPTPEKTGSNTDGR